MSHRTTAVAAGLMALSAILASAGAADATTKREHLASYQPKIICGQTGCFEIPRGCEGELRRTGRTVVAVVICDRK